MKKFTFVLALLACGNIALAEKIPVKITPAQVISTSYDEIETGDIINFKTTDNVMHKGILLVPKDAEVTGKVDYFDENGWVADSAEIVLKDFKIKSTNGKLLKSPSVVTINGFEELKNQYPKIRRFWNYLSVLARGKEIDIKPETDKSIYTIWLEF